MYGTLFFDKQDRELLRMINETIDHGPSQDLEHKVLTPTCTRTASWN